MATRKRVVKRNGSKKRKRSKWEDTFMSLVEVNEWPTPEREFRFHEAGVVFTKKRQWRFDFCWPDLKLAVEIDGGIFSPMSGHRSPTGITEDRTKDAVAQLMDWIVLRFTEIHFREGLVELLMEAALDQRRAQATFFGGTEVDA